MRLIYRLLILPVLLLSVNPAAAEPIRIKFSHVVQRETPKGKASEYFKRLVEQRSNNRVQVEIYPEGVLTDDQHVLDALRQNRVQLAAPSLSKLTAFDPQLQLFDLPFLFRDESHLRQVIDGDVGQHLLESASKDGLVALCFWENGFKQLTANRPLVSPRDFDGLNIRIEGSEVQRAQYEALGASTTTLPFQQLYVALESTDVDGQENSLSNIYSQELYKVQSDMTLSDHAYSEYLVLTNRDFWDQVPEDLRVIIRGAIEEAAAYAREMAVQINRGALENIRRTGRMRIHALSASEKDAWRKSLQEIYPRFAPTIGSELIRKAQDAGIR